MYSFIYLASKSPRRQQLLEQIEVVFKLLPQDIDESALENEKAYDFVNRLAREKALSSYAVLNEKNMQIAPVLAADTIVTYTDNGKEIIFGKPQNKQHAIEILGLLSGSTHSVLSAVCVTDGIKTVSAVSSSKVTFSKLSRQQIESYWESKEPADKAGAYAIQGKAASFISHISGSYSGIMGLPLYETSGLLKQFDLSFMSGQ